jgi:hypothetical protein
MIRYGNRVGLLAMTLVALGAGSACIGEHDVTGPQEGDDMGLSGTIVIAVNTTGSNPDPDGYTASLDEALVQPLEVNGSVTFSGVRTGSHAVHLDGVATNCVPAPSSPVFVTLVAESTVSTSFTVTCS